MLTPYLETPRVALRPATQETAPEAYEFMRRTGLEPLTTLDEFQERFPAAAQKDVKVFAIHLRATSDVVGLGSLRDRDPAGHTKAGISMDTEKIPYGVGAEAMMMLVNYAFAAWPDIRRVYIETTDASLDRFKSGLAALRREATLPDHVFFRGRLWDMYYYAITRNVWQRGGAAMLERLVNRGASPPGRRTAAEPRHRPADPSSRTDTRSGMR